MVFQTWRTTTSTVSLRVSSIKYIKEFNRTAPIFAKTFFAKNLAILDSKLTRTRHHHAMSYDLRQYETAHEKLLKTIKTPEQLLEEYTTKANQEQIDE